MNKSIYTQAEWIDIASKVKRRDRNTCRLCKSKDGPFHAHHLYYRKNTPSGESYLKVPLRFIITVCDECHAAIHEKADAVEEIPYLDIWGAWDAFNFGFEVYRIFHDRMQHCFPVSYADGVLIVGVTTAAGEDIEDLIEAFNTSFLPDMLSEALSHMGWDGVKIVFQHTMLTPAEHFKGQLFDRIKLKGISMENLYAFENTDFVFAHGGFVIMSETEPRYISQVLNMYHDEEFNEVLRESLEEIGFGGWTIRVCPKDYKAAVRGHEIHIGPSMPIKI